MLLCPHLIVFAWIHLRSYLPSPFHCIMSIFLNVFLFFSYHLMLSSCHGLIALVMTGTPPTKSSLIIKILSSSLINSRIKVSKEFVWVCNYGKQTNKQRINNTELIQYLLKHKLEKNRWVGKVVKLRRTKSE